MQSRFRERENRPGRGQHHDDDDEQGFGVGDGVVEIVGHGVPPSGRDEDDHERHDPQGKDHFHLSDEVNDLGKYRRRRVESGAQAAVVVPPLHANGKRGEAGGQQRVNDRQEEDGRPNQVQHVVLTHDHTT